MAEELFRRVENIPLIDKYDAYQFLTDEWQHIAEDIETISSDGFEAVTAVEPNIVLKKVKDEEEERRKVRMNE